MIETSLILLFFLTYLFYAQFIDIKNQISVWPQYSYFGLRKFIIIKILKSIVLKIRNRKQFPIYYTELLINVSLIFLSFYSLKTVLQSELMNVDTYIKTILIFGILVLYKDLSISKYSFIKVAESFVRNFALILAMIISDSEFTLDSNLVNQVFRMIYFIFTVILVFRNFKMIELCNIRKSKIYLMSEMSILIIILDIYYRGSLFNLGLLDGLVFFIFPFFYLSIGNNFTKIMHKNIIYISSLKTLSYLIISLIFLRILLWRF